MGENNKDYTTKKKNLPGKGDRHPRGSLGRE